MRWPKLHLPQGIDWALYLVPLLLTASGITIIFSITYGTKSTLAFDQIIFTILGFAVAVALTFVDYRLLKGLYLIFYGVGLGLLVLVLAIGSESFGANRWINLGIFQLQPSEIFKLIALIVLARFFSDWQEIDFKKILLILAMIGLPIGLILLQPDLGTASVIIVTTVVIFLFSPIKKIYLAIALAVVLILSPLGWKMLKPYQKNRIQAFVNPSVDPQGIGYNVSQSKIAVGSGGLWGAGLGMGTQSQLNFLPVAHTDFIFASTAEATGFIGSIFLLILLVILVWRVVVVAETARDRFGMFLSLGIGTIFLFQILVNIGMNMGIMPVTGIPLPFVSAGGSATLTNMVAIGILQSIYLRHKITF